MCSTEAQLVATQWVARHITCHSTVFLRAWQAKGPAGLMKDASRSGVARERLPARHSSVQGTSAQLCSL